jgi:hypothetical protein
MELKQIISQLEEGKSFPDLIKVDEYIPFSIKRVLTDDVVGLCIYKDEETDLLVNDILFKDLLTVIMKTLQLTDVEIENMTDENGELNIDVVIEAYDSLMELGIYEYIKSQLKNDDIDAIIEYKIKQRLETYNSVGNVIKSIVNELVSKIPSQEEIGNLMTSLPFQLEDLKNLKILNPSNKSNVKSKTNSKTPSKKSQTKSKNSQQLGDTLPKVESDGNG